MLFNLNYKRVRGSGCPTQSPSHISDMNVKIVLLRFSSVAQYRFRMNAGIEEYEYKR